MLRTTFLISFMLYYLGVFSQQQFTVNNALLSKCSNRSLVVNISSVNGYISGQTMDLQFNLQLVTPDNEYGDSISILFPAGFTVNAASNPITMATEGQSDESLNLPISGQTVTWGDNDNNYGGIESGVHTFWVNVSVDTSVAGMQSINWYVSGDEYGASPNFFSGATLIPEQLADPDLAVAAIWANKYLQIPQKLNYSIDMSAIVVNNGTDLNQPVNVSVLANSLGYNDSETTAPTILNGQADTLFFNTLQSGGLIGSHTIVMNGTLNSDPNPLDNVDTIILNVTDSSLSYYDTLTNSLLGIGDGSTGVIGSFFLIPTTERLSSISAYAPSADSGNMLSFVIYEKDTLLDKPGNLLWESDTVLVSGFTNGLVNLPCSELLKADMEYFIGVREQLDGALNISGHTSGFFPRSHYVLFQGSWVAFEQLNFMFSPAIIPQFSTTPDTCIASFTFVQDSRPFTVKFQNQSSTSLLSNLNYHWTIEDSVISTQENPTITFDSAGTYSICLKVESVNCSDSTCLDVMVSDSVTSIRDLDLQSLSIYPNPASQKLIIKSKEKVVVEIFSLTGSIVFASQNVRGETVINLSDLVNGVYLVKLSTNNRTSVKQLVIRK